MKIMIITKEKINDVTLEMLKQLDYNQAHLYQYNNDFFDKNLEEDQKYFDCIYTPNPDLLLKIKPRIPYFYDIPSGTFDNELNFKTFHQHYSQIGGAKAVFVSDKKMSRYAAWEGLYPFWVNEGIDFDGHDCIRKKFFTPNLHIGYINEFDQDMHLIEKVNFSKKSNWFFHLYNSKNISQDGNIKFYEGNKEFAKKSIYQNCHIIITPYIPHTESLKPFPSNIALEAMYNKCVSVSGNIHENADNVLFDNFHYFRLDFIDTNTVVETLRYADKRRDKLERMSVSSKEVVKKYFNAKESAKSKLDVIRSLV